MIVLGIESSCDETATALVTDSGTVLASRLLSQIEQHKPYGGVVPEIAARAHLEHVDTLVAEVMNDAGLGYDALDGIAAAAGPGLIGGVIVGVMTAKAICFATGKPFIAVNHLEGHALTVRLGHDVTFPYLLLLASGGHCQILAVEGVGKYKRLGTTIDDAAGEAFDKTAKMLGLGYPGGPKIELCAAQGHATRFKLPRPLKGKPGCDLSFSGLKTATRHLVEKISPDGTIQNANLSQTDINDICAAFQLAVTDSIKDRLGRAIHLFKKQYPQGRHLVTAGGVAANNGLRAMMQELACQNAMEFVAPPLKLCTDNGTMIAWAGLERLQNGLTDTLDFKPRPRWPLDSSAPKARGAGGVKA